MNIAATISDILLINTLETAGSIKGLQSLQTAQETVQLKSSAAAATAGYKAPQDAICKAHAGLLAVLPQPGPSNLVHTRSPFEFIFYFYNPSHASSQYMWYSYDFRSA
jgi:hypothetical protein